MSSAELPKRTRRMRRLAILCWVGGPVMGALAIVWHAFWPTMPGLVWFLVVWITCTCFAGGYGFWYRSDPVFDFKNHEGEQ